MALADFQGGMHGALQQMLASRMEAQKLAQMEQQQAFQRQIQERQLMQGDQRIGLDERGLDLREQEMNTPQPERPMSLGEGQSLIDPSTGRIIAAIPKTQTPERPMSLSPGASLVDPSTGRIIAAIPDRPEKPGKPERSMEDVLAEYEAKKKIDAQYTGSRPSLGAEKSTLNYFNRMLEAERNARAVEDQASGWDVSVADVPGVPAIAENYLRSEAGQKYTQAQRAYTEARLRKESGAAIPQSEFDTDRRTNFRTAGDKPETIKQKRGSRLATMRGIGNAAGRALQEFYGDDTNIDKLLAEFAEKEADVPMVAPDGRSLKVPANKVAEMEAAGAKRR